MNTVATSDKSGLIKPNGSCRRLSSLTSMALSPTQRSSSSESGRALREHALSLEGLSITAIAGISDRLAIEQICLGVCGLRSTMALLSSAAPNEYGKSSRCPGHPPTSCALFTGTEAAYLLQVLHFQQSEIFFSVPSRTSCSTPDRQSRALLAQ